MCYFVSDNKVSSTDHIKSECVSETRKGGLPVAIQSADVQTLLDTYLRSINPGELQVLYTGGTYQYLEYQMGGSMASMIFVFWDLNPVIALTDTSWIKWRQGWPQQDKDITPLFLSVNPSADAADNGLYSGSDGIALHVLCQHNPFFGQ